MTRNTACWLTSMGIATLWIVVGNPEASYPFMAACLVIAALDTHHQPSALGDDHGSEVSNHNGPYAATQERNNG